MIVLESESLLKSITKRFVSSLTGLKAEMYGKTQSRIYACVFYIGILLIYVAYYGARDQVDFTAFYRAANLFTEGSNPYDRDYSFYFLNAPSALIILSPLAFFDLELASIVYRCISLILLIYLCQRINRDTKLNYLQIFSILILSTPIRATFGSGLGGVIVAISVWHLAMLILNDSIKYSSFTNGFFALGVLSFKPYLFIGIFVLYLALRRYSDLLIVTSFFLVVNLILSIDQPLLVYWLENLFVRSDGLLSEDGASSIVSIITRITMYFTIGQIIAWPIYIIVNLTMIYLIFNTPNTILKVCFSLTLSISAQLYINHRDYVILPLIVFILLNHGFKINHYEVMLYFSRCGLLLTSALFQFFASVFEPKSRVKAKILLMCCIPSFVSGFFWNQNLEISFLIYDISMQIMTIIIFINLIQIRRKLALL
jgi:hypothetical protein